MSTISIRPAASTDVPEIAALHILAWQQTYPGIAPQPFLDTLNLTEFITNWTSRLDPTHSRPQSLVVVAIQDEKICGFIHGGAIQQPVPGFDAELYGINILRHAKGNGLGKRLVKCLAEGLKALGFRNLVLWVLIENAPAKGFYERMGAGELGERKYMELPGASLLEVAYGWRDLRILC